MAEFDQKIDIFSPKTFLKSTSTKKVTDQIGSFNSRNHSTQNLKANKFQNFPQQFANFQPSSQERIQQFSKKVPNSNENNIQFPQKVENFQNKQGQIISNKENIVLLSNQNKEKQQQDSQQRNSIIQKKPENKMKNSNIQQNHQQQKVEETRSSSYLKKPFSQQNYQPEQPMKNSQQVIKQEQEMYDNQKIEQNILKPQNTMKESLLIDKFNSQFSNVNSPKIQNPMMFINKDKRPNSSKVDVQGCKEYFQSNYARQPVQNEQQSHQQRPSSSNQPVQKFKINEDVQNHYRKNEPQQQNDKLQFQEKKSPTYQSQIQEPAKNLQQQKNNATRSQVIEFGNKMNNLKVKQFFTNEELYGTTATNTNQQQYKSENPIQAQKSSQIIQKKTREQEKNAIEEAEQVQEIDQKDNKNFKQEYQEYQKLQEKLNYLETKINSIKTNINHNYQKESQQLKKPEKFDINLKFSQQLKSQQTPQMKNSLVSNPNNQQFRKKDESNQIQQEMKKIQKEPLKENNIEPSKFTKQQEKAGLQDFITQVKPPFAVEQNQDFNKKQEILQEKMSNEITKTFLNQQKQPTSNSKQLRQSAFQQYQYVDADEKENQKKSQIQAQSKQKSQSSQSLRNSSIISKTKGSQFIYYVSSIISAFQNRQDNSYFAQLAREHLLQSMQAISFVRNLKLVSPKLIDEKKIILPKKDNNKKTLVFDLDETLIHCQESTNIPCDVILPIKFPTGELIEAGINIRPYCLPCLQELSKYYEIIVFTASHSCYANVVLDYLDPNQKYISARLYRENCIQTDEGVYIKDLRVLQNRSLNDIIIVDNASYSFGYQIENGLPILPYYDNKNDIELKNLISYLKSIHHVKDVREVNKKMLKINQFGDFQDPVLLIQSLFSDLLI